MNIIASRLLSDEIMEEIGSHTLDQSKDWVGQSAVITLGDNDFVGVVTAVNMAHNHGLFGDLIIKGYSNTILLDAGEHIFSWTDKSFKDVIKETIDMAGVSSEVKPEFKGQVAYIAQHGESHFTFIKRLAKQYNEWMFYNGEKLIFGKPDSMPTIPISYGTDLDNIQVSVRMRPVKYSAFSYSAIRDEQFDGVTKNSASGQDELGDQGFTASTDNFNFNPHMRTYSRTPDKGSLDDMLLKRQQSASANLSQVSGSSSKQELRPDVIADIKANIFDNKSWQSKTYGQYLITAVHHHATGDHVYSNHFEYIYMRVCNRIISIDIDKSNCVYNERFDYLKRVKSIVLDEEKLRQIPLVDRLLFVPKRLGSKMIFHKSLVDKIMETEPIGLKFMVL